MKMRIIVGAVTAVVLMASSASAQDGAAVVAPVATQTASALNVPADMAHPSVANVDAAASAAPAPAPTTGRCGAHAAVESNPIVAIVKLPFDFLRGTINVLRRGFQPASCEA